MVPGRRKTLSVTSQNAITNGGVMQGDAMVLGAGEAFTNNGMLTAGKGNSVSAHSVFSLTHRVHFRPVAM